jgi:tol-pal system protein YbgF
MGQRAKGSLGLPIALSALLAALGAGCAAPGGEALEQDLAQLRQDLSALTLAVHRSRADAEATLTQLDRRTREQGTAADRQLSALSTRVEGLAAEVARASARLDELAQRLEQISRRAAAPPAAPPPSGPAPAPGPPAGGGPTAEQAYQAAYRDFTRGNYPLAIAGFQEFLRRHPDAPRAEEAQYWLGEAHLGLAHQSRAQGQPDRSLRELEQAVREFRRVALDYPRGRKVPTAIYKEALALIELGQPALARSRLQYLLEHFPRSEEAPLARERLGALPG